MDPAKLQERHPTRRLTRRRFSLGLCLGLATTLAGCGGWDDDPPPSTPATNSNAAASTTGSATGVTTTTPPVSPLVAWDVTPDRALTLPAGATFDLAATLPSTAPAGGRFEVDASGTPLPAGITLQPNGLLAVSNNATGGTAGVVFRYTPPA